MYRNALLFIAVALAVIAAVCAVLGRFGMNSGHL
jgi:hypothetical protein